MAQRRVRLSEVSRDVPSYVGYDGGTSYNDYSNNLPGQKFAGQVVGSTHKMRQQGASLAIVSLVLWPLLFCAAFVSYVVIYIGNPLSGFLPLPWVGVLLFTLF